MHSHIEWQDARDALSVPARSINRKGNIDMSKFPKGFLVGAATAAHQVEGNNTNCDCWAQEQMPHTTYKEKSGIACDHYGYTKLDHEGKQAAYPFGYGLSYTSFALGDVSAKAAGKAVRVQASVENTGACAGAEVVQVYAGSNGAANGGDRPVKLLKGFSRVELKSGEKRSVTIDIPLSELRFYDHDRWVLDRSYTFYIGTSSADAAGRAVVAAMPDDQK